MCLEQDLGKERVEERETGVMTEEIEASLEEVDAISRKFSLSLKALTKENKSKLLIIRKSICGSDTEKRLRKRKIFYLTTGQNNAIGSGLVRLVTSFETVYYT